MHDGRFLFIDEVHRYPGWSTETKNIYDFYPDLKVVATGSSAIAVQEGQADLSRRASVYHLHTLSLREYLAISQGMERSPIRLTELLQDHESIAWKMNQGFKPIACFREFLKSGAYPFADAHDPLFYEKLKSIVNLIIDHDIPAVENITYETRIKLKKLLYLISSAVPFKPNIAELRNAQKISWPSSLDLSPYLCVRKPSPGSPGSDFLP